MACYNRKDKTLQCLKSLFAQQGISVVFEINVYLVDDNSTDGTSDAVKLSYPLINIIEGNGHLYWNRGMYMAWVEAAKGIYDYYLWLNDDTMLFPGAIMELLHCENLINNSAVVCGAICSESSNEFTYGGKTKTGSPLIPNGFIQEAYTINGNCVLVSNIVFQIIGYLDPIFPHAIGDYEYGLRAIKKGFKVLTTRAYVGNCERNALLPRWCYSNVPLFDRFKSLYSPLGNSHPYYYFLFENRHYGLPTAVKHFITIHLRALIPSLWK